MRIESVLEVMRLRTFTSYRPDGQEVQVGEVNLEDSMTDLGANVFVASQAPAGGRNSQVHGVEVFVNAQEAAHFRVGQRVRVILEVLDD